MSSSRMMSGILSFHPFSQRQHFRMVEYIAASFQNLNSFRMRLQLCRPFNIVHEKIEDCREIPVCQ